MEKQLKPFANRFGTWQMLQQTNKEDLEEVRRITLEAWDKMPFNKKMEIGVIMKEIRTLAKESDHKFKSNVSSGVNAHILVEQDNCDWYDCHCGGLGKFTKIG